MTIYIFDDFCIERVTGRGHNISDLCCKVFVGIHTFYESRTVVESRYIDGQQINSLSGLQRSRNTEYLREQNCASLHSVAILISPRSCVLQQWVCLCNVDAILRSNWR